MINDFKELLPYIVSNYEVSDYFHVVMTHGEAPHEGTKYDIDEKVYEVTCVSDVSTGDDKENGWCYHRVTFQIVE